MKLWHNLYGLYSLLQEHLAVRKTIGRYGYDMPPIMLRVLKYSFYDFFSRSPFLERAMDEIPLPLHTQHRLGVCFTRFVSYLTIMAYDDAIEKYNLDTAAVYDQLSRCMVGLLIGLAFDFPLEISELQESIYIFSSSILDGLAGNKAIHDDITQYCINGDFLIRLSQEQRPVTLEMLLYHTEEPDFDKMINVTIVACIELGRTIRQIVDIAQPFHPYDDPKSYVISIVTFLIKLGHAQANSISQKHLAQMTWLKYIPLAYNKSSILFDLHACMRSIIDPKQLYTTRFHSARFCEQIYLDDFPDFEIDTRDGVLNVFGVFLLEQGRLAEELWSHLQSSSPHLPTFLPKLETALADRPILQSHYEGTFLLQNPYVKAKRNGQGELLLEVDNAEAILQEAFVNSAEELNLTITDLLSLRIALYRAFAQRWRQGERHLCAKLVYRSSIPVRLSEGFLAFLNTNKSALFTANPTSGRLYYSLVLMALHYQRIGYLLKHRIQTLRSKELPWLN